MLDLSRCPNRPVSAARVRAELGTGRFETGGFRRRAAACIIALASIVWISGLTALGYAQQALPWCLTLAATAFGALASTGKRRTGSAPRPVLAADWQPVSFMEAYALTYMIASIVLSAWIVYHLLYKPPPLQVKRQVVDIELTALADFADRGDPLPGSEEKPTLRKRKASTLTSQGDLAALPTPASTAWRAPTAETGDVHVKAQAANEKRDQEVEKQATFIFQPSTLPVERQSAAPPSSRKPSQTADDSFWQEVRPPELVELTDNEGDDSLNVWQPGGHSQGGTGSKSQLSAYLKELNKRIKIAWFPPAGDTWKTEILFRIRKSGQLASARLFRSSGNLEADEAAMSAIVSSAPFKELPADYPHPYLDLHYSFNYNVDQLTEVTGALPR